jgi:mRNA-degrading endonuclease toxin of MazEF toxin-antitoxin module
VTRPLCGSVYELLVPGAQATRALVLTEDEWNTTMNDSVVVPIYSLPDTVPSLFFVALDNELRANCTRVQSMPHEFLGESTGVCSGDSWVRTRIGIRRFLDIDRRVQKKPSLPPTSPGHDWWPVQNEIHFGSDPPIGSDDKLYAIISDDDWNSLPATTHAAAVRLTSKTKRQRLRWEVPVTGGCVVTGDIYSISYTRLEQTLPSRKYPSRLSDEESSLIAARQKTVLTLH